jgi:hypothetical protein
MQPGDPEHTLGLAFFLKIAQPALEQRRQRDDPEEPRRALAGHDRHPRGAGLRHPIGDVAQRVIGMRGDEITRHRFPDGPGDAPASFEVDRIVEQIASREDPEQGSPAVRDRVEPLSLRGRAGPVPLLEKLDNHRPQAVASSVDDDVLRVHHLADEQHS